jgi:hypothetical protein
MYKRAPEFQDGARTAVTSLLLSAGRGWREAVKRAGSFFTQKDFRLNLP